MIASVKFFSFLYALKTAFPDAASLCALPFSIAFDVRKTTAVPGGGAHRFFGLYRFACRFNLGKCENGHEKDTGNEKGYCFHKTSCGGNS
jgi:hypothetical protein